MINYVLIGFAAIYILHLSFAIFLERLNLRYVKEKAKEIPALLKDVIDINKLYKINAYNLEKSRLGQIQSIFYDSVFLWIVLSGKLSFFDLLPDSWASHYILAGILFFLVIGLMDGVVEIPFDYYHTFVVEEKYGFNKSTIKLWITDHLKNGVLSIVFLSLFLSPILWLIEASPNRWWFWSFLTISLVQILMTIIYPVLIAPIFNKFEPLKDEELAQKVRKQMDEAGIKVKDILQMDAGKRSRHTNAYFTGLGKTKRIVFYDTLIKSHSHEEILAILAHEAGHYKKKHILKQLFLFEASMLIMFYLFYLMLNWKLLPLAFGFQPAKHYICLLLLSIFWERIGYFFKPIYMALSRRFERQADMFSLELLKTEKPMINSLKKIAVDNLANLNPHPFYVWFNYSHPPLTERIALLKEST